MLEGHFEVVKAALQQGKHVLVEKPMTDNAGQAAELVELAQRQQGADEQEIESLAPP